MEKTKENMKKKRNKGFSLVELIVVIAIMGILAVTITPKFMHYLEKSRKAADQQVVSAVYDAVKFGLVNETIYTDALKTDCYKEATGKNIMDNYIFKAESSGKSYKVVATSFTNTFEQEIATVVGNFKLKAEAAEETGSFKNTLTVKISDRENFVVTLAYAKGGEIKLDSNDVR